MTIKRILVALDASTDSVAALVAAADMAVLLQLELVGLFVEDVNLQYVAQLPFVSEVRYPLAEVRRFDLSQIEHYWQSQAAQALFLMRDIAQQKALDHSFEVVRGPVAAKLLAAALDTDILALGRLGRSLAPVTPLGSTARTVVAQAQGALLLMPAAIALARPVLLLYDGTAVAQRALAVAKRLAEGNGRLRVLIWTNDNEIADQYRSDVLTQTHDSELEVSFRRLHLQDIEHLADVVAQSEAGILVIGHAEPLVSNVAWQVTLEQLNLPVLIIR